MIFQRFFSLAAARTRAGVHPLLGKGCGESKGFPGFMGGQSGFILLSLLSLFHNLDIMSLPHNHISWFILEI